MTHRLVTDITLSFEQMTREIRDLLADLLDDSDRYDGQGSGAPVAR